jgi:hypothetical protein
MPDAFAAVAGSRMILRLAGLEVKRLVEAEGEDGFRG